MRDNAYRKTNDGFFDFYVNVKTGEKKFALEEGDTEVDDFGREIKQRNIIVSCKLPGDMSDKDTEETERRIRQTMKETMCFKFPNVECKVQDKLELTVEMPFREDKTFYFSSVGEFCKAIERVNKDGFSEIEGENVHMKFKVKKVNTSNEQLAKNLFANPSSHMEDVYETCAEFLKNIPYEGALEDLEEREHEM